MPKLKQPAIFRDVLSRCDTRFVVLRANTTNNPQVRELALAELETRVTDTYQLWGDLCAGTEDDEPTAALTPTTSSWY